MKKDLLLVFFLALLLAVFIQGVEIQSVEEYYDTHPEEILPGSDTVTISIRCDTIYEHYEELDESLKKGDYLPQDGIILPETELMLLEGDTVFDLLERVVRYRRIPMEYQGADENSFGSVYVQGIQYLYEFSCGPLSGWMYAVNGKIADVGCSRYEPEPGDVICWFYTCELGKDVEWEE